MDARLLRATAWTVSDESADDPCGGEPRIGSHRSLISVTPDDVGWARVEVADATWVEVTVCTPLSEQGYVAQARVGVHGICQAPGRTAGRSGTPAPWEACDAALGGRGRR